MNAMALQMEMFTEATNNYSIATPMEMFTEATNNSVQHPTQFISDSEYKIYTLVVYVILCGVVSFFGSVANVINIIVFYRQGLDTTINISFFSLAIADLFSLVYQQLFNIFLNPLFVDLDLPLMPTEIQFLTTGIKREMFARVTCQITAFITAERCLCVVYPLHIKRIITPRRSTTLIAIIYIFTLLSPLPIYSTSYFDWKFYPDLNRTFLGISYKKYYPECAAFVYFTHALFTMLGFLCVLTFTLILIYKLGQKGAWLQSANVDQEKAKSMSKRDRATITMVVLIAGILVVCYTPAVLLCLSSVLVPDMSIKGAYSNLYQSLWSFAMLFENINSSVNIYLYYRMSSNYRRTFRKLVFGNDLSKKTAVSESVNVV